MKITFYKTRKKQAETTLKEIHRGMSLRQMLILQAEIGRDGVSFGEGKINSLRLQLELEVGKEGN